MERVPGGYPMKPIDQIALELAAKLGWVPDHDDLADEVIDNIANTLRARDQEWREAVEEVAKEIDSEATMFRGTCTDWHDGRELGFEESAVLIRTRLLK